MALMSFKLTTSRELLVIIPSSPCVHKLHHWCNKWLSVTTAH